MRDAARDVAPGGHALGRHKVGHVIKGHDIAFELARLAAPLGHAHQQAFQFALAGQADLFLHRGAGAVLQAVEKRANSGTVSTKRPAMATSDGKSSIRIGGAVDEIDPAFGIKADHPGRDV